MTLFIQDAQKGDAMICEALKDIECLQKMMAFAKPYDQDSTNTPLSLIRLNPATERVMP